MMVFHPDDFFSNVLAFNHYVLYCIRIISSLLSIFELTMNKLFVFRYCFSFQYDGIFYWYTTRLLYYSAYHERNPSHFHVTKLSKRTTIEAFFSSIVSYKSPLLANIPSTRRCIALINFNYNVKQRTWCFTSNLSSPSLRMALVPTVLYFSTTVLDDAFSKAPLNQNNISRDGDDKLYHCPFQLDVTQDFIQFRNTRRILF